MHVSKNAILTALATGSVFILIPIISKDVKQLIKDKNLDGEERRVMIDTVVPISYNLPLGGAILSLIFIPFAAWFYGQALSVWDYPQLIGAGVPSMFGTSLNAILFLLNYFHIPIDIIDFFTAFKILTVRTGALFSAVYMTSLAILCTAWSTGFLKINLRKIVKNCSIAVIATVLTFFACTSYLRVTTDASYDSKDVLAEMQVQDNVKMKVFRKYPTPPQMAPEPAPLDNRLELIKNRGILRVGYNHTSRPFSYFNSAGVLEGHDIAMATMLAKDLGCSLEFIPIEYDNIGKGLSDGVIDLVMAGVSITAERIKSLYFTDSYMQVHLAFVVKDYKQEEYSTTDDIREKTNVRIASVKGFSYRKHMERYYPNLKFVDVEVEEDFFSGKVEADALLISAEEGFAWCLLYPNFCVAVPHPKILTEDLAYVISQTDLNFCRYLNTWLQIKKTNGTLDKLYRYWIMGKNIKKKEKRWCVWDDFFE